MKINHRTGTPHPWCATDEILREELGPDEIDPSEAPIGVGSVAQVYRGRLLRPNTNESAVEVAVKVNIMRHILLVVVLFTMSVGVNAWNPWLDLNQR